MKQPFERLLVGHTLAGRYRVDEGIGAGGMSVVFRGQDLTLGRPVAVKVVSIPADSEGMRENLRERFRREAASAASIPHHPNVVQVYDYGTDPALDLDFIVMELLNGRDLKEHLTRGAPPYGEAMRIVRDAARGVAAGHRAGIIHRDVKPANVFLVGSDELEFVRVLDFGIAKPLGAEGDDGLTTIGQLPHSPAYAAPEQLNPDLPVTQASDVYQLGLVSYETLTGERPFTQTERERILAGEDVPLGMTDRWQKVPEGVREVVERALRTDSAARYRDAVEYVEALVHGEQEHTRLQAAPVASASDTRTIAQPPIVVRSTPPAAPEPVPLPAAHGVPVRDVAARRKMNPLLVGIPLLLVAVLALWALTRGGGEETSTARSAVTDTAAGAELDETFTGLQGEASARAPSAAPAPQGAPAGTPVKSQAQLAAEVEQRIRDLNNAWVQGDLGRHVSHYASRVDYYNSNNLPRAGVRRDRGRDMRRYDVDRQIIFHNVAITFPAEGEARALVDKEWVFRNEETTRRGRGMQEYLLKRDEDDGKWYVTSEQLLQRTEAQTPVQGAG